MRIALLLATAAVGVVLNVAFEATLTRILGMLALFAFIVGGVFLIADPRFLERED